MGTHLWPLSVHDMSMKTNITSGPGFLFRDFLLFPKYLQNKLTAKYKCFTANEDTKKA